MINKIMNEQNCRFTMEIHSGLRETCNKIIKVKIDCILKSLIVIAALFYTPVIIMQHSFIGKLKDPMVTNFTHK